MGNCRGPVVGPWSLVVGRVMVAVKRELVALGEQIPDFARGDKPILELSRIVERIFEGKNL